MDIHIRLARKSDLSFIIEMSKCIYDGHDYFPRVFLQWLENSDRRIIVAEKGGVVVGIRAFHIIDGGKTVVSQSLRVHPKYRGQGVSTVLILAERQYVQSNFPCVVNERYTTMSTNVSRLAIQRKSFGESFVLELGIIAFYVNSANFLARVKAMPLEHAKFDPNEVRSIETSEFQKLLKEGRLDDVLQNDTLIIDWEPFKGISSNINRGLVNEDDCLYISEQIEGIKCLSHGRLSPRVKCQHWVATLYTENVELIKVHIAKQLEHAIMQARNEQFIFSCFLPTYLAHEAKGFVLEEFSLKYVDFFNFNLLLFEKHSPFLTA